MELGSRSCFFGYITTKMFSKIHLDITTTTMQQYIIRIQVVDRGGNTRTLHSLQPNVRSEPGYALTRGFFHMRNLKTTPSCQNLKCARSKT